MKRLLVSFSGGRTSGYMTHRLLTEYRDKYEMVVVFANTGEENEATLKFVRDCDEYFGFGTVWIEAVQRHGERKAAGYKVVSFETAARQGEPFEDMIQKYGIPNKTHPHCTRSLKRIPMEAYMRDLGWGGPRDYLIALGIRTDERRRVHPGVDRQVLYPLIDLFPTDKHDVLQWWSEQAFDLDLLEHEGNCKWCWKKSFRKHSRLIRETPGIYDFPRRMEETYGYVAPPQERPETLPRVFFRENTSTNRLFLKVLNIPPWADTKERADEDGGCTESCELLPTQESLFDLEWDEETV